MALIPAHSMDLQCTCRVPGAGLGTCRVHGWKQTDVYETQPRPLPSHPFKSEPAPRRVSDEVAKKLQDMAKNAAQGAPMIKTPHQIDIDNAYNRGFVEGFNAGKAHRG